MDNLETATLAAGCFWCVEAIFNDLKGVEDVVSGYSGGHTEVLWRDDDEILITGRAGLAYSGEWPV